MELFTKLEALLVSAKVDAEAFYTKGNKAAGTRLRVAMLEVKKTAHEIRQEVSGIKSKEVKE